MVQEELTLAVAAVVDGAILAVAAVLVVLVLSSLLMKPDKYLKSII